MCRRAGHGAQTSSLVALACLFVAVSAAARAHAQPSLEDAERTLENAEFERALTQLQALADDESLAFGRDELARLLRLRAVAAAALGRDDEAREALRALSTLLSGGPPGPLPPPLAATYAEVRSTAVLELQVALTRDVGEQVRASVAVQNDPAGLVRHVVLRCAIGEREIARTRGDRLVVRAADGLVCHADAIGPAGYPLGHEESRWVGGTVGEEPWDPFEEPPKRRVGAWVGGILGAAVVVAGAITLGVLAARRNTTLEGPTWEDMR
ncbi:MAG: hypothetical protein H6721_01850 [Sandaracinus sp.]|nr:hypothetical protein [Sandaracinus sp.]